MSEIRRVNTGDAPRNVYHAGDAPRTVNTGRTVKTGSALNQDEYEAARRRAQQLAANNTRRTRSFNRVQQTDVDRYRAAQQKEQEARAAAAQQQAQEARAAREAAARQQAQAAAQSEQPLTRAQRQALELQRRARSQSAQGATRTQVRRLDLNETKGSRAHYDMNADAEYQARVARRAAQTAAQPAAPQAAPQQEDTVMQASRSAGKPAAGSGKSAAGKSGSKSAAGGGGKPPKGGSRKGKGGAGPYGPNGKKKKKGGWWKALLGTLLAIAVIFFGTVVFIMHAIAPSAGSISLNQLINTPKEYAGKEFNLLVVGIDRSTETGQETDSQVDDGMTDMILYLHFNNETGQVKMLQIPRNIFVTTDASFSGNYQINAIAKTQGSNGGNNISALADEIYNIFGLHVDGYLSVRLEALTQIIDTFGGIRVYVPQDMDYGGSHLSQGYQTMDGAAAEFFLRTRHIYADSDLGRLRMQRYFYAALFARMRSMTVWDIAKLLPVITALGCGVGDEIDLEKLRYGKVIVMADADVDGSHIRTLLLTFFFRFMRPLIEEGYVYSAVPPLYKLTRGKTSRVAYSDEERDRISAEMRGGNPNVTINISRFKGLGEMDAHELWETTMDPTTRTLRRITLDDAVKADATFTVLMGEKVEPRKEFIEQRAKYAVNLDY